MDLYSSCCLGTVATVVGALYLVRLTLWLLKCVGGAFCAFVLAPCGISRVKLTKYGQWAVVTGASEGIGRGYALELARQGLDVVLMSRSEEKLQKVANEIKEKHGRKTLVVPVDFSAGQAIYPAIAEQLRNLDIGVLVNNVGLSYECPDYFLNVSADRFYRLVELNCQSMIQMTHIVLMGMTERKRGVIVNISSLITTAHPILMTVYAASKAFVDTFSEGLRAEYSAKGIIVQNVNPGVVATAMSGLRRAKVWAPSGETYSRSAVATIGIQKETCGYWFHAFMDFSFNFLSPFMLYLMKRANLGMKKAYMKKKNREKKE